MPRFPPRLPLPSRQYPIGKKEKGEEEGEICGEGVRRLHRFQSLGETNRTRFREHILLAFRQPYNNAVCLRNIRKTRTLFRYFPLSDRPR